MNILKSKKPFLLLFSFAFSSLLCLGQGSNPVVTLVPTITHGTCSNPLGSVSYSITVSTGWQTGSKINSLVIRNSSGSPVYSHTSENSIYSPSGSASNLPPGSYNFVGSVTVKNTFGNWVSVSINRWVWVGIKTEWDVLQDMIASPNSYSATRNTSTQAYGGAYSKNFVSSGDAWIQLKANYGTSSSSRVFLIVGETDDLTGFDPNGNFQYIEFFKTSSGSGIRVRQEDYGSTYTTTQISTNPNDVVRLVRKGTYNTLFVQLNNSPSNIFTFDFSYAGPMNIGVFTVKESDAALDVVSSMMSCGLSSGNVSHAQVQRKLSGGHTLAIDDLLKISYTAEYDVINTTKLNYKIYRSDQTILASSDQTGTTTGGALAYSIDYADNRYEIDLSGISGFVNDDFYTLEITSSKGEKWYLKFLYKN